MFERTAAAIAAATLSVAISGPASALEAYTAAQNQQFMDWCTGAKAATESTCSCTLKSVAQTVPATTLAQYLNSQASNGGFSFNATLASTTALVTQALATCASK
jgi:hypothetical protein